MRDTTKMLEDNPYLDSYLDAPWPSKNIVHEDENVVVYKDGFPVTEGHLLFVPKKKLRREDITICFEYAYKWGIEGIMNYKWKAFNIGINNGVAAGQTVMWPHVHLIPRREGDLGYFENGTPYDPKGGVRNIIPHKGHYDDAIFSCPTIDDNTPREELDAWSVKYHRKITRLKTAAKETRVVMGVCFGEFDYSAIQYHGKTKNYKKQKPENET